MENSIISHFIEFVLGLGEKIFPIKNISVKLFWKPDFLSLLYSIAFFEIASLLLLTTQVLNAVLEKTISNNGYQNRQI